MEREKLIEEIQMTSRVMFVISSAINHRWESEELNKLFRAYDRLEPTPPLKFVSPVPDAAGCFLLRCKGCDDLVPIPRCGEVFRCHACGTTATAIEIEKEFETRCGITG